MSYKQLRGSKLTDSSDAEACHPVVKNSDLKIRTSSVSGKALNMDEIAHPCGISARSFFNDTFTMKNSDDVPVEISAKGIAWEDDIKYRWLGRGKQLI